MSENLHIAITGDNQGFINALNGARAGVRATAREVENSGGSIEQMFNRIKIAATATFAGFSAAGFVKQVATIRGEFQQLEAAFTTLLGSAKQAQSMMADLTKLAATTPFDMQGVAQGAKQLLAYGVAAEDVTSTMRKLGDISAGLSLNLNDLVWLYGTTLTQGRMFTMDLRQFQSRGIPMAEELAKIFGVQKNEVAGLVTAGKVGSKEVIQAIDNMTKAGSQFGGLMDMQSRTITGQIRNIEDTIDMAFNDLGKQSEGIINDALSLTATLVDHWQAVGAAILYAAETIGLYKAASLAISRFETNATNMGYDAEIAQLATVIPQKEADANADLQQAVAEGKLTEAKAAKLAAMREEAQAYVQELQQKANSASAAAYEAAMELQNAEAKKASAVEELDAAKEKVQSLQDTMNAAMQKGDYEAVANARTEMGTAINQANTASQNVNTASKQVAAAQTKAKTTAQAAETAQTQLNTAQTGLNTAATAADIAAKGLWTQVTQLATRAQEAFNASMFASPLFWIAAVIAGVTFAIYKLATADSAAEAGQKRFNDELERTNEELEKRKQKTEQLIQTIQSETSTDFEKTEAYEELSKLMPSLTEKYTQAELAALDFSKAQKDVGENIDAAKIEEARKQVDELKESIERIKSATADDAKWNGGRGGLALGRELETEQEQLERAENQVLKYERLVEEARTQAEEASKPIEVKLEEAQQNYKVKQDIFDFYKEAMDLAEQLQAGNEEINYATGQTKLDEFIANAQTELEDLRRQEAGNPLDLNLRMREEEKTKVLNGILDMKQQMVNNGSCIIPLWFQVGWNSLTNSVNEAKNKVATLAQQKADENFGTQYNNAKSKRDAAYKKLQKINKNRSKYTVTDYKNAKKEYDDAEKDFTQNYGGTSINNKAANAAKQAANQAKKEQNEHERAEKDYQSKLKELQRQRTQLEQDLAQSNVDVEEDVSKKELAQMRLNQEKEMQQLDQQQKDYIDKKTEMERAKAKANGTTFTDTATLDESEQQMFDKFRANLRKKHEQEDREYYQQQADDMNDYLKEYGSFEQKRLAITEEYANKIKKARSEGEELQLQKERDKKLSSLSYEDISMGIDWKSLFSGIGSMTTDMMQEMQKKLQAYTKTDDYRNADSQTQQDIVGLLQEMRQYLGTDQNTTWESLETAMNNFNASITKYQTAQANEKNLIAARDEAKIRHDKGEISDMEFQRFVEAANQAGEATANARKNVEDLGNTLNNTADEVANFTSGLTAALNNLKAWKGADGFGDVQTSTQNVDALKGALDSVLPSMGDGIANTIGEKMSSAMGSGLSSIGGGITKVLGSGVGSIIGIVAQIPKLILQIARAVKNFVVGILDSFTELFKLRWIDDLVDSILGAVGNLINAIFDLPENLYHVLEAIVVKGVGGLLNTVVGRIGNILTFGAASSAGPASWFANSNAKQVAKTTERLTTANEALTKAVDDLKDSIDKSGGKSAVEDYQQAYKDQEAINKNTMAILRAQMGYHGAHHSNAYYWNLKDSDYAAINQTLAQYAAQNPAAKTSRDSVHSLSDIYELTPEQMKAISSHNVEIWQKMLDAGKYDKSEYWENYIELAGQLEELTEKINENLTQTSFDTMKSNFVSDIMDMKKTFSDFSDDFSEMIAKAWTNAAVNDLMSDDLQKFYGEWADKMKNGTLTKDDVDAMEKEYEELVGQALNIRETMSEVTGYTGESSEEQNASANGVSEISYDQANTFIGLVTAGNIVRQNISDRLVSAVAAITSMSVMVGSSNGTLSEIRNLMIYNNSYLEDILKFEKNIYNDFSEKIDQTNRYLKEMK